MFSIFFELNFLYSDNQKKYYSRLAHIIEKIVQKYAYIIETSWITCNYHCSRRDDSPEDPMIYVKIQICGTWYFNDSV